MVNGSVQHSYTMVRSKGIFLRGCPVRPARLIGVATAVGALLVLAPLGRGAAAAEPDRDSARAYAERLAEAASKEFTAILEKQRLAQAQPDVAAGGRKDGERPATSPLRWLQYSSERFQALMRMLAAMPAPSRPSDPVADTEKKAAARAPLAGKTGEADKGTPAAQPKAEQAPVPVADAKAEEERPLAGRRRAEPDKQTDEARADQAKSADAKAREDATRAADAKAAVDTRKAAEAKAADEAAKAAEAKRAADATAAEDAKKAADAKAADEASAAETKRVADAKVADDARKAAEAKRAEDVNRAAHEAKKAADAADKAEETRQVPEAEKTAAAKRVVDAKVTAEAKQAPPAAHDRRRHTAPATCSNAGAKISLPGWYVAKNGDTLWGIARAHYGYGRGYRRIHAANRRSIRNPDRIYVCQRIYIPRKGRRKAADTEPASPAPGARPPVRTGHRQRRRSGLKPRSCNASIEPRAAARSRVRPRASSLRPSSCGSSRA